MPQTSVVLPFFNRSDVLADSVASVLDQSTTDLELILVDDGSTDGSLEVCERFRDARVRIIQKETREGVSAARNLGISFANGEFLAFQDSDDVWHPRKLELQLEAFEFGPSSMAIAGSGFIDISKAFARPSKPRVSVWEREAVISNNVAGLGTPMLLVARNRASATVFDTQLPALVERDFVLGVLGQEHHAGVVDEPLVRVTRGRSDHVASASRAMRGFLVYLEKYGHELTSLGIESDYHYYACREALRCTDRRTAAGQWSQVSSKTISSYVEYLLGFLLGSPGLAIASRSKVRHQPKGLRRGDRPVYEFSLGVDDE